MKRFFKILKNNLACWRNIGVAEWEQQGNMIVFQVQRINIFGKYKGRKFIVNVPINKEKLL